MNAKVTATSYYEPGPDPDEQETPFYPAKWEGTKRPPPYEPDWYREVDEDE